MEPNGSIQIVVIVLPGSSDLKKTSHISLTALKAGAVQTEATGAEAKR
jgi:hypothetical protein